MVKNTKGGNKAKGQKNSSMPTKNREIPIPEKEDDSHVAVITKVNGDGRYLCDIIGNSGVEYKGIPVNLSKGTKNKYGKGTIVSLGTYILIARREFQKDKGDVIFIYKDSEKGFLENEGIIPNSKNLDTYDDDTNVIFSDVISQTNLILTSENNEPEQVVDLSGI